MKNEELNTAIMNIQEEIFAEAKNSLGAKGFERWRNPKYFGVMEGADSYACLKGSCGDTMEMYIRLKDDRVEQASYITDGCSSSSIAGSFAAQLAVRKTLIEILDMTAADVLQEIGAFPEAEEHCAHLAVRTLQEAVNSYLIVQAKNEGQRL